MNILRSVALLGASILFPASLQAAPLKVYILAGQSNMQGHSSFKTLGHLKTDDTTKRFYDAIVDEAGKPREIDRVWISYLNEGGREKGVIVKSRVKSGPLKHGYGAAGGGQMGPELGFGIAMSELYDGPILIIKAAFGGTSLNTDWRPPSAGPWTVDEISAEQLKRMKDKGTDPQAWVDETNKKAGFLYRWMIDHARKVLADPGQIVPDYDEKAGYEIAGFTWFQGSNDKGGPSYFDGPGGHAKYTEYLAEMIHDIRRDLNAPNMRVSVGAMGFKWAPTLYQAQLAIAEHPDFKGQAVAVPIHPFVDPLIEITTHKWNQMKGARSKWKKESGYDQRTKEAKKLTGDARKEALDKLKTEQADWQDKHLRENMTAEEYHAYNNYISAFGYHFSGSAKFFARAGDAFAQALQDNQDQ